jgi:hypothetical protein
LSGFESPYAVLQVDPAAEPEVIESAYRRLARKYHPDVNRSHEANARMRAINQAYAMLGDPVTRAMHEGERRRAWTVHRLGGRPLHLAELGLRHYQAAIELVRVDATSSLQHWAGEWSACLDSMLAGDILSRQQLVDAGNRSLIELADCLARWEAFVPPPPARRLGHLGATCLRLELALVRGGLALASEGDPSMLPPLARLAEWIGGLSKTVLAEITCLDRQQAMTPALG